MNRRVPSYPDSFSESYVNSTRTISSSSSIISTPSNRKHQTNAGNQQNQGLLNSQNQSTNQLGQINTDKKKNNLISKTKIKPKKSNVNLVKNKLLNLQKSLKIYTKSDDFKMTKNFIVRRPINMNHYDYSVFTKRDNWNTSDDNSDPEPPCVKESQIKAWESAEKISNNLIFDHDSDLSDEDDNLLKEEGNDNEIDDNDNYLKNDIIKSIPGYTKNELELILRRHDGIQILEKNFKLLENEEKQELYKLRQSQQAQQEKFFNQYQTLTNKRKIQVNQKKELFNKIFGYNNLLNQEYITNNTSYSSLENVMNTQKSYHEDKSEISTILEQDKMFNKKLLELKDILRKNDKLGELKEELDYEKFQKLIYHKLSSMYNNDKGDDDDDEELGNFVINYLRKCIKDDDHDRL